MRISLLCWFGKYFRISYSDPVGCFGHSQIISTAGAEDSITAAITELSRTATSTLGPLAWTYIIYYCTLTWPLIYFLQLPNFSTSFFGLNFVNRRFLKRLYVLQRLSLVSSIIVCRFILVSHIFVRTPFFGSTTTKLVVPVSMLTIGFTLTVDIFSHA